MALTNLFNHTTSKLNEWERAKVNLKRQLKGGQLDILKAIDPAVRKLINEGYDVQHALDAAMREFEKRDNAKKAKKGAAKKAAAQVQHVTEQIADQRTSSIRSNRQVIHTKGTRSIRTTNGRILG